MEKDSVLSLLADGYEFTEQPDYLSKNGWGKSGFTVETVSVVPKIVEDNETEKEEDTNKDDDKNQNLGNNEESGKEDSKNEEANKENDKNQNLGNDAQKDNATKEETKKEEVKKEETKKDDATKAGGTIPYAGGEVIIVLSAIAIIGLGIYLYRKNKDLRGI